MFPTEKYSPVLSWKFNASQMALQKKFKKLLWLFPLKDLEAGKLLISESFAAFEKRWFLCMKAQKNMQGGMCMRQLLYCCRADPVPDFRVSTIEFKLVDFPVVDAEALQSQWINVSSVVKQADVMRLFCKNSIEEPLSELRRRYSMLGTVCLLITMAIDPEPSTWDSVTDKEFFGMEGISFDDQPISMEHPKLESGECDLVREILAGGIKFGAESRIHPSSCDEPISTEQPKLESGIHKLPQEKVSKRDEAESSIDPKSDDESKNAEPPELVSGEKGLPREKVSGNDEAKSSIDPSSNDEPIDAEPPKLDSGAREFPPGDPTELESSDNPNLEEGATKETCLKKKPVRVLIDCMSIHYLLLADCYKFHSTFSFIWAILDLMAFVIYWGMYRKENGENTPTADDYKKAYVYDMCLLLALTFTHTGLCYVSPFLFFAFYLLCTNRVTGKNVVNQLLRNEILPETEE